MTSLLDKLPSLRNALIILTGDEPEAEKETKPNGRQRTDEIIIGDDGAWVKLAHDLQRRGYAIELERLEELNTIREATDLGVPLPADYGVWLLTLLADLPDEVLPKADEAELVEVQPTMQFGALGEYIDEAQQAADIQFFLCRAMLAITAGIMLPDDCTPKTFQRDLDIALRTLAEQRRLGKAPSELGIFHIALIDTPDDLQLPFQKRQRWQQNSPQGSHSML